MIQEQKADGIVVSFCIAAYDSERFDVLKELLDELLSVDSDQFEIVVSDDHSSDSITEKLKVIKDARLKVFRNAENVGAMTNMYEAFDRGIGTYLFYVNDRDNVDASKVKQLIEILKDLKKRQIAFGRCITAKDEGIKYHVYKAGEDALVKFACKIDHPTGYFFDRDCWKTVRGRKKYFADEKYGYYGFTMVGAILAEKYSGAEIYGDICDRFRQRIDFKKERSDFFNKRKDKRMWYSPEVQERELEIAYRFLKAMGISESITEKVLVDRFREYMYRVVVSYEAIVNAPEHTYHYGIEPPKHATCLSVKNGIFLWSRVRCFMKKHRISKGTIRMLDKICIETYQSFFALKVRKE